MSSKQNRLEKHRGAVRDEIVATLLETNTDEMTYGLVTKHSGNGQMIVTLPTKMDVRAVLRGLLSKCNIKNVFPTGTIVVLGTRDFETKSQTYDVMAILDRKEAKQLVKQNKMPAWMISMADGTALVGDAFEFDYEDAEADAKAEAGADAEKKAAKAGAPEDKARRETLRISKRGEDADDDFDIDAI